jgi:hypothetical protein
LVAAFVEAVERAHKTNEILREEGGRSSSLTCVDIKTVYVAETKRVEDDFVVHLRVDFGYGKHGGNDGTTRVASTPTGPLKSAISSPSASSAASKATDANTTTRELRSTAPSSGVRQTTPDSQFVRIVANSRHRADSSGTPRGVTTVSVPTHVHSPVTR